MTATLDNPLAVKATRAEKSCECQRSRHHPGHQSCDQSPKYAVRISHYDRCGTNAVYLLCQDCLDEAMRWASAIVNHHCGRCLKNVRKVSDLVGRVVRLW
jgi:hypothetical protein